MSDKKMKIVYQHEDEVTVIEVMASTAAKGKKLAQEKLKTMDKIVAVKELRLYKEPKTEK